MNCEMNDLKAEVLKKMPSTDRAIEIMREIKQNNYSNLQELQKICDKKVMFIINDKGYSFWADWDIDDYKSEVFTRVWTDCAKFDESRGSFSTWFFYQASDVFHKHLIKKDKKLELAPMYTINVDDAEFNIIDFYEHSKSCEEELFTKELRYILHSELAKLPDIKRDALILCEVDGYKPSEAAEILGCKSTDIYRWNNRSRDRLYKRLYVRLFDDNDSLVNEPEVA